MLRAAEAVAEGRPAIGAGDARIPNVKLASFEGMVPRGTDWRMIGVSDEERGLSDAPSASRSVAAD
jgi:phthalate 4,5-dioxygenase oxygenase subunit